MTPNEHRLTNGRTCKRVTAAPPPRLTGLQAYDSVLRKLDRNAAANVSAIETVEQDAQRNLTQREWRELSSIRELRHSWHPGLAA